MLAGLCSCFSMPASLHRVPALVNCYSLKGVCPSRSESGAAGWGEEVMELLVGLNGDSTLDALLEPGKLVTLYLRAGGVGVSIYLQSVLRITFVLQRTANNHRPQKTTVLVEASKVLLGFCVVFGPLLQAISSVH